MREDMVVPKEQLVEMYRKMIRIRKFELEVSNVFLKGYIPGTIHLYNGEEAVAVGAISCLRKDDVVLLTHRPHGHAIAKGMESKKLMAEIVGRVGGCTRGKGGSMHIVDVKNGIMPSIPIIGAGIPIAAGIAFSFQQKKNDSVAMSFFGDGTTNIGAFHEGINLAAVWNLPVVFVIENNSYAVSTNIETTCKLDKLAERAKAYGIPGVTVDGNDVEQVYGAVIDAVERARKGQGPSLIECLTYRHSGHSRTDPGTYRSKDEVAKWLAKDPVERCKKVLLERNYIAEKDLKRIDKEEDDLVKAASDFAISSPEPPEELAWADVM